MQKGSSPLIATMAKKSSKSAVSPMDIFRSIENKDRNATKELVMRNDVSLGLTDSISGRSLMYCLLNKVCNGDKLVKAKLDSCLSTTNQDPDSEEFSVLVDHSKLVLEEDRSNLVVIEDLLQLPRRNCRRVLHHPVILTYIQNKWKKTRWTFLVSFLLYLMFVLMYSSFLGMLYWRNTVLVETTPIKFPKGCSAKLETINCTPLKVADMLDELADSDDSGEDDNKITFRSALAPSKSDAVIFVDDDDENEVTISVQKMKKNRSRSRLEQKSGVFSGCFKDRVNSCGKRKKCTDISHCIVEIMLVISIFLLVVQELWQCIALKKQYFKELENWFELVILSFAVSTLSLKKDLDNLKTVAALGVCLAWLELIFLFGRYPSLGGKFSIMYYTATKRVIKTALGFFVMILGFSFAFFIINFGSENESFDNPLKASLKILAMVLGEYEFDDLYEGSYSEASGLTGPFTMILFFGLIVFGSIIMVNLIVAIIITDIDWLNQMSKEQALLNQAQHALQIHALLSLSSCLTNKVADKKHRSDLLLEFCPHTICSCSKPRLPRETREAVFKILEVR